MSGTSADSRQICSQAVLSISDGRAGNARQADALAEALSALSADAGGGPPDTLALRPRAPWRWAAPRQLPGAGRAFGPAFDARLALPPRIAVGCGRQAALATRLLRARGTRVVQILDPRIASRHWDVVVVPEHDRLRGDNVIPMLGSLHPVDDAWLAAARAAFAAFAALPAPRTALLLGGPSAHATLDVTRFEALAVQLETALSTDGGSVLATASRRTPPALREALRRRFGHRPGLVWCGDGRDGDRPNPYPGLLAWADRIVCTADSVNMVSEACATRAPVFVAGAHAVHGRPRAFLQALLSRGRIHDLETRPGIAPLEAFDVEPLRETARVAARVAEMLMPDARHARGDKRPATD